MGHRYAEIAFTDGVKAVQRAMGSRDAYARREGGGVPDHNDRLGPDEADFVAARDGFYVASVSETGWPYVQFRGGPPGFLRVLDERTLGFADLRGNRQYVTTGNLAADDRVSLFLMDYARRRRLKVFGRARVVDARDDPALAARLAVPGYRGVVERAVLVAVEAFDWNCPQHITPRFTLAELERALAPVREEAEALRAENEALRRRLEVRAGTVDGGDIAPTARVGRERGPEAPGRDRQLGRHGRGRDPDAAERRPEALRRGAGGDPRLARRQGGGADRRRGLIGGEGAGG